MEEIKNQALTVSQAAKILNIHINTLRRWTNNGTIKSQRVGPRGDRRLAQQEIDRFINASRSPRPMDSRRIRTIHPVHASEFVSR